MKQNITIDQLNELSEKGKERLTQYFWNKIELGPKPSYFSIEEEDLNIGTLIEFLDEHVKDHDFDIRIHSAGTGWEKPGQRLVDLGLGSLPVNEIEDEVELCDALWEAVRSVLEQEEG